MKRLLISATAVLSLLSLNSCSQDDFLMQENDGKVNFSVKIDSENATRAFGDGTSATTLQYAVYDNYAYGPAMITSGSTTFTGNTATVSLDLTNGQTYNIVFFAYNPQNGVYSFDGENKTVSVNYAQMATTKTAKDYDCFYKKETFTVGAGGASNEVVLTRPVAQINWGTSDKDKISFSGSIRTKFKGKAYKTLNLLDGSVADEVEVIPTSATTPLADAFPVEGGYDYLNCTYVLVPEEGTLIDCELEIYNSTTPAQTVSVPNVPVQRNYRTNIYGKLLTSTQDFIITKDPIFDGELSSWDGTPGTMPEEVDGVYSVSSAPQLAAIAQHVNSGNTMKGKTIKLAKDINLNNVNWTPIGMTSSTPFSGNFDGDGHTIYNLKIDRKGKSDVYAGLFGYVNTGENTFRNVTIDGIDINVQNGTANALSTGGLISNCIVYEISNVHVKNVNIRAYRQTGGIAGAIYGHVLDCSAENVNIALTMNKKADGNYDNGDKAGAIFGYHGEGEKYKIENNRGANINIVAFRDSGGLFGMIQNQAIKNNSSADVTITVTLENAQGQEGDSKNFGPIVGRLNGGTVDDTNTNSGYKLIQPSVDIADASALKTAVSKGGYVSIAENTNMTIDSAIEINTPTQIHIPAGSTLNLGGNRISNNSELELSGNGTITGTQFLVVNNYGGTMYVKDGNFKAVADYKYGSVIHNEGDMIIDGGYFEATDGSAVKGNFQKGKGSMVINGGTFINSKSGAYTAVFNGNADVEINGGIFMGYFGCIETLSSVNANPKKVLNLTINNGTFLAYGEGNTYYALCLDPESNNVGSNVTVNGGKFWAKNSTLYCKNGSTLTLKGGMFKSLNGYAVANGFKTNDINLSETVTAGNINVNPTYNLSISK